MTRAAAESAARALDLFRPELFEVRCVNDDIDRREYHRVLRAHYEPLGFYTEQVLPSADSVLFMVRHEGSIAAIFRLTGVDDPGSPYFDLVPGARDAGGRPRKLLEVNNVVIARTYRASIVLGLLLYRSACEAHARGYDFVVGLNRLQILRFFVAFGIVPVDHPPLRLLGKEHLNDFINYYDTADPVSVAYMHERAKRYFHQEYVMRNIQEKYARPLVRVARATTNAPTDPVIANLADVPSPLRGRGWPEGLGEENSQPLISADAIAA
jgi:hypothetical protein